MNNKLRTIDFFKEQTFMRHLLLILMNAKRIYSFLQVLLVAMLLMLTGLANVQSQSLYTNYNQSITDNTTANVLSVDINGDATADFSFSSTGGTAVQYAITINPLNGNEVLTSTSNPAYAAALQSGQAVGASAVTWATGAAYTLTDNNLANLATGQDEYIGIGLQSGANWYYGWIRVTISSAFPNTLTVEDFAYEATANTPITLPAISSTTINSTTSNSVAVEQNNTLTITTPPALAFCGNSIVFTLKSAPASEVTINLQNAFTSNGQQLYEFYDGNGNVVTEVVFAAGASVLTQTLSFVAFKYTTASSPIDYTYALAMQVVSAGLINNISLQLPDITGSIPYEFVYDPSSSTNVPSYTITGEQNFTRTYQFDKKSTDNFDGNFTITEVMARPLSLISMNLVYTSNGATVSLPGKITANESSPAPPPTVQNGLPQYTYTVTFNNIPLNSPFSIQETLSVLACNIPAGDDSYIVSSMNVAYSCNKSGTLGNYITNNPITTSIGFQIAEPAFGVNFSTPANASPTTLFDGCLSGNQRNVTMQFYNNNTSGTTGSGYVSSLIYYGFNGADPVSGVYPYTYDGQLVTTVVPVNSISVSVDDPNYKNLFLGIDNIKTVTGAQILQTFTSASASGVIDPLAQYVELVRFKFDSSILVGQSADLFTISYTAIDLCPNVLANKGYYGGGLFIVNADQQTPALPTQLVLGPTNFYNTWQNSCHDVKIDNGSFWNECYFAPYELFHYNAHTIEYVSGPSEMPGCSPNWGGSGSCTYATVNNPTIPSENYTQAFNFSYSGSVGAGMCNHLSENSLGDTSLYQLTIVLTGTNGLVPAPLPNGNAINGNLSLISQGYTYNPDSQTIISDNTNNNNQYSVQYQFNFTPQSLVTKQSEFFTNGVFDFNQFIANLNITFQLSALCSLATDPTAGATYSISVYENIQNNGCTACALPVATFEAPILIDCPGCINAGMETQSFVLQRVRDNTSFKDGDNNGIPDNLTNGLPDGGMLLNRAVTGDVVMANTSSELWPGTSVTYNNSPGTNDLLTVNNGADYLNYLYRVDEFGSVITPGLFVDPASLNLKITRNGITYDFGNLGGNLNVYQDNVGGTFTFECGGKDILTTAATLSGYSVPFLNPSQPNAFFGDDVYDISVNYVLTGGFDFNGYTYATLPLAQQLWQFDQNVTSNIFLSVAKKCTTGTGCANLGYKEADQLSITAIHADPELRFECQGTSQPFTFYDYGVYLTELDPRDYLRDIEATNSSCSVTPQIAITSYSGYMSERWYYNMPADPFPYEYRPGRVPSNIRIQIPNGYTFSGGYMDNYLTPFLKGTTNDFGGVYNNYQTQQLVNGVNYYITPVDASGNSYLVINPVFDRSGTDYSPQTGTVSSFFAPSDRIYMFVYPTFTPTCTASNYVIYRLYEGATAPQVIADFTTHYFDDTQNYSNFFNNYPTPTTSNSIVCHPISFEVQPYRATDRHDTYPYPAPADLTLVNTAQGVYLSNLNQPTTVVALNSFVNSLNNNISLTFSPAQNLKNLILSFSDAGAIINSFTIDGSPITITNNVAIIPSLSSGTHTFNFNLTFTDCNISSLQMLYGYSCNSSVTVTQQNFAANVCQANSVALNIEYYEPDFAFTSTNTQPVCDNGISTITHTDVITMSQSSINNVVITIPKITGLTYVPNSATASITNPGATSGTTQTISDYTFTETATSYQFSFAATDQVIGSVAFAAQYVVSCAYSAANPFSSILTAKSPCGAVITQTQTSAVVNNANSCANIAVTTTSKNASCAATGAITINASGGVAPYSYSDNGGTTYQSSDLFTGLPAATYTVIVQDANGCTASAAPITITSASSLPSITGLSATPSTVCVGSSIALSVNTTNETGGTPPYTYSWTTPDGKISSNNTTTGVAEAIAQSINSYPATSTNTFTITVTDANNCTNSSSVPVTVNPDPNVAIDVTNNLSSMIITSCSSPIGGAGFTAYYPTLEVSAAYSGYTNVNYQWMNSTGAIAGATNATYQALSPDTYYLIVTNTITNCSGSSNSIIVTGGVTVTGNSPVCPTDDPNLQVNVGGALNMPIPEWFLYGSSSSLASPPTTITTNNEQYYAELIVQTSVNPIAGCTLTTQPITITLLPAPTPYVLTANGPTVVAPGTSVELIATAPASQTEPLQSQGWGWVGGTQACTASCSLTVTQPGTYTYSVLGQNGCIANSTINVISPILGASFSCSGTGNGNFTVTPYSNIAGVVNYSLTPVVTNPNFPPANIDVLTTPSFNSVPPGTYLLTTTSLQGMAVTQSISVPISAPGNNLVTDPFFTSTMQTCSSPVSPFSDLACHSALVNGNTNYYPAAGVDLESPGNFEIVTTTAGWNDPYWNMPATLGSNGGSSNDYFMLADGPVTAQSSRLWYANNISINQNSIYIFSVSLMNPMDNISVSQEYPGVWLQITDNFGNVTNITAITDYSPNNGTSPWNQMSGQWTSGEATSASIAVMMGPGGAIGRDLTVDDIIFAEVGCSNGSGSSNTMNALRTIYQPPCNASVNVGSHQVYVCTGGSITIGTAVTTIPSGVSYQWSNSAGVISGATSPNYSTGAADVYTLTATDNVNHCSTYDNVTVTNFTPYLNITSNTINACSPSGAANLVNVTSNATVTNNSISKSGSTSAWDAGASSSQLLDGSANVQATIGASNMEAFLGLSYTYTGTDISQMDYGIYFNPDGSVTVLNRGVAVYAGNATYSAGQVVEMAISLTGVNYYIGSLNFYSQVVSLTGPLAVNASLYSPGAAFNTINITNSIVFRTNVFSGMGSGSGSPQYQWYINNNLVATTTTGVYTPASIVSGNQVSCQLSESGCTVQSNVITMTSSGGASLNPPVVVSPVTYCQNTTSAPLAATGTNLLWYTNIVGGTGSIIAPTPSTSVAGTFNYYVSQTISSCETERSLISVVVNPSPTPGTIAVGPSTTVCAGTLINIDVNYAPDQIVSFNQPVLQNQEGGGGPGGFSVHGNAATGGPMVLIKQSSLGCLDTTTVLLIVNPIPTPGTIAVGPSATVCSGTLINIDVNYAPDQLVSFNQPSLLNQEGGGGPGGFSVHGNAITGGPLVLIKQSALGCLDTSTVMLTVNPDPTPGTITVTPSTTVPSGTIIDVVVNYAPDAVASFTQPSLLNQQNVTGQGEFGFSGTAVTSGDFVLVKESTLGCTDTTIVALNVTPITTGIITSKQPADTASVSIFPNPSNGYFNMYVHSTDQTTADMFVYDVNGILIESGTINTNEAFLFGSDYIAGLYLVQIVFSSNKIETRKLIKMN